MDSRKFGMRIQRGKIPKIRQRYIICQSDTHYVWTASIKSSFRRVDYRGSHIPKTAIVWSSQTENLFRFFLKTETSLIFWTVNRPINPNVPGNRQSLRNGLNCQSIIDPSLGARGNAIQNFWCALSAGLTPFAHNYFPNAIVEFSLICKCAVTSILIHLWCLSSWQFYSWTWRLCHEDVETFFVLWFVSLLKRNKGKEIWGLNCC